MLDGCPGALVGANTATCPSAASVRTRRTQGSWCRLRAARRPVSEVRGISFASCQKRALFFFVRCIHISLLACRPRASAFRAHLRCRALRPTSLTYPALLACRSLPPPSAYIVDTRLVLSASRAPRPSCTTRPRKASEPQSCRASLTCPLRLDPGVSAG